MSADDRNIPEKHLQAFLAKRRLPESFRDTALSFFLPLAAGLARYRPSHGPLLLGINGAQGTGKSTLADFLELATAELFGWRTAVLSIDDFYLTRAQRRELARDVHPLFATRGVPGTHDTGMLANTLQQLRELSTGVNVALPRFDKSVDDRADPAEWPEVTGPLDLVVLEGWCVGSTAEDKDTLGEPVNSLELDEDPDAVWRTIANEALARDYEPVFAMLDALVFLAAPSFEAIFRWRLEQEQKLADAGGGSAIMSEGEIARFICFYERITRNNLRTLPARADAVLVLDEHHAVVASR